MMTHDEHWIKCGGTVPTEEDIRNRKFVPGEMVTMYNDSKTSWNASRMNLIEEIQMICGYCKKPLSEDGEHIISISMGYNESASFHQKCFMKASKELVKKLKEKNEKKNTNN